MYEMVIAQYGNFTMIAIQAPVSKSGSAEVAGEAGGAAAAEGGAGGDKKDGEEKKPSE